MLVEADMSICGLGTCLLGIYGTLPFRGIGLRVDCALKDGFVLIHASICEKKSGIREGDD